MALEQRNAHFGLKSLYPVGHVRLYGIEFAGRPGNPAAADDRDEGGEVQKFHRFPFCN
jgi:hypothetical protein